MKPYLGLLLILLLAGCARNPVTRRTSLHLYSDSKLNRKSEKAYTKYLSQHTKSTDAANVELVNKVGGKIATAVDSYMKTHDKRYKPGQYKWEFNLIQDPTVNAWCMPGGKVVVYSGILPLTQDEDGLAAVLGHEISHAVALHTNREMSQNLLVKIGGLAVNVATMGQGSIISSGVSSLYGATTKVGILLPHSRKDEYEADHMGLVFMAMAGYDPHKAIDFWKRMDVYMKDSNKKAYLSDHPGNVSRINMLKKELPEAMKYYKKSGVSTTPKPHYNKTVKGKKAAPR